MILLNWQGDRAVDGQEEASTSPTLKSINRVNANLKFLQDDGDSIRFGSTKALYATSPSCPFR